MRDLHIGHDGALIIGPAAGVDAERLAHQRSAAVGTDDQPGLQAAAIGQFQHRGPVLDLQLLNSGRAEEADVRCLLEQLPECQTGYPVLDDVSQVRLADVGAVEVDAGAAHRVPDLHLAINAGAEFGDARPGAQTFEDALAGAAQGGDAQVQLARGPFALGRLAVDDADAPTLVAAGTGHRRADHAAADDEDVEGFGSLLHHEKVARYEGRVARVKG